MSGAPDPKPVRTPRRPVRTVDAGAMRRARLRWPTCVVCGQPSSNADHVVPRGRPWHGDDVDANLVALCGTGTSRCHGARHGSPYTDTAGKRWTPADVRRAIGEHVKARRPDVVRYVLEKLGDTAGRDYLRRRFDLEV